MVDETATDKITKSARGEDKPLDAKQPTIPFALVWGAYPILLIIALLAILAVFWLMRSTAS